MTATSSVDSETGPSSKHEERKVLAGTLVGTTIEWYDFFIFAQLTGTLLSPLFLTPLQQSNPGLAQILSFALIGISFLFRPLGAVIAGHLGDRLGRKAMLVFTLVMMGAATSLIGILPTYKPHRRLGTDPADHPPDHPGLLSRRRMGRSCPDGRGARADEQARNLRRISPDRRAHRHDPRDRPAVLPQLQHVQGRLCLPGAGVCRSCCPSC